VVLASSAKLDEVEHYVELLDARDIVDAWTSSGDVDRTKPHPDLITTAADRLQPSAHAVVFGDTAWDAVAAGKAGLPAIGLLTGGFGAAELRDAGCCAVYADAAELAASLDEAFAAAAQSARGT
jgi:phosphoglycolate phosphatase-like HAD superfamily hydrolase